MFAGSSEEEEYHWANKYIALPYEERDWSALHHLLNRTWFERLWIRQEIAFSKSNALVMCGMAAILWHDLRKSNQVLRIKLKPGPTDTDIQREIPRHTNEIEDIARYNSSIPAWKTLRNARFSKCSDPRDRVYANLSFIQDAEGDVRIVPDYLLPVSDVYLQIVIKLLEFQRRLDILRCCELT
jgi:hypothetical protein